MVIVAVFALLALFSIVSIVLSAGDRERSADPTRESRISGRRSAAARRTTA